MSHSLDHDCHDAPPREPASAGDDTPCFDAATFDALSLRILAHDTVTAALADWRQARGFGDVPLEARLMEPLLRATAGALLTEALELSPADEVLLRRVQLLQGGVPLLEANNWFVPRRLPAGVAEQLGYSGTPFGRLLAPHGIRRRHLTARLDEAHSALVHRAVVTLGEGPPVALVEERFLPAVLAEAID